MYNIFPTTSIIPHNQPTQTSLLSKSTEKKALNIENLLRFGSHINI